MLQRLFEKTIQLEAKQLMPIRLMQSEKVCFFLGQVRMQPDWFSHLDCYRLVIALTHREKFFVNGNCLNCDPLTVLVISPGQPACLDLSGCGKISSACHLVLTISPDLFRNTGSLLTFNALIGQSPSVIQSDLPTQRLLLNLLSICSSQIDGHQEMLSCLVNQLLLQLMRQSEQTDPCCDQVLIPDFLPGRIQNSFQYMINHLNEKITLSKLAELSAVSNNRLIQIYRDVFGLSPYQLLMQIRIMRSKTLLAETRAPVSAISTWCGFCSSSHFATVFRREVGMTPIKYRERLLWQ